MDTVQMNNWEVWTISPGVLGTVAMHNLGTQTERMVLSKVEWQSRLSFYISMEMQIDAFIISGGGDGSCAQAQERTLGKKWSKLPIL
jgi:hypothetical protein